DLRQVLAGGDAELGGERLHQHRDQVARQDHPHQPVPEFRATLDVGGEVAGIDIGDGRDERRPEEGQNPEESPPRAASGQDIPRRGNGRDVAWEDGDYGLVAVSHWIYTPCVSSRGRVRVRPSISTWQPPERCATILMA